MSDFKAKMHQIQVRLGLRPRPRWGAYSAPPDPLAVGEGAGCPLDVLAPQLQFLKKGPDSLRQLCTE